MSAQLDIEHAGWCTDHRTEYDMGDVSEVCRGSVTVGEATVDLEASPSWTEDDLPIVTPEWTSCDAKGARDLATALVEAARLIEDAS